MSSVDARPSGALVVHPLYAVWAPVWTKLAHVFEGSGGFLDGTYLVAHPREWDDFASPTPVKPSKKLLERRAIARYENLAALILNQLAAALFRGSVTRLIGGSEESTKKHPLSQWWANVDSEGTAIGDYMAQTWPQAALFGHVAHVMDRPDGEAPATKADEQPVYLCAYNPLMIADWTTHRSGSLSSIKLLEEEPRALGLAQSDARYSQRTIDADRWTLTTSAGQASDGEHKFGRLPVVLQFSKRRALSKVLGQSVLNDPQLYIDLYNLTSEQRELLRKQVFSLLNIVLGTGDGAIPVADAEAMLNAGGGAGTSSVLFSGGAAQFITAEVGNVEIYLKTIDALIRTIYRLAGIPFETDSRDAEAEGSRKIKREDMAQILSAYADECEKAEYQFVELWFRAEYGPDRWKKELEKAEVVIRYPDTFDVTPFAEILEQAQAAMALEMGQTFMKELRRRIVADFLPDASPDVLAAIDAELEQMAKEKPEDVLSRATTLFQQIAAKAEPPTPEVA